MITQVYKKPYLYFFIILFTVYLALNITISQFYVTVQYLPKYVETIKWEELVISGFLTLIIAFLVALTGTLIYKNWKERISVKKQTALVSLGTLGGLATGVCTACVAGLFPLIFGLFGVSFSFLSLPFKGMEIQLLVITFLSINLYLLMKRKGC